MARVQATSGASPSNPDGVEFRLSGVAELVAVAKEAGGVASRVITLGEGENAQTFVLVRGQHGDEYLKPVEPAFKLPVMAKPGRIVESLMFDDQRSFIEYVNGFKTAGSRIFADLSNNRFTVILDHHEANGSKGEAGAIGHAGHAAIFQLRTSSEFKAWEAQDGKMGGQLELVRFLEENREDIIAPDSATLLEHCRDLQALRSADFRSIVREDSENYRIEFKQDANVASKNSAATLPAEFVTMMPIYFGSDPTQIHALLRWHVDNDNQLKLGVKLKRVARIKEAIFHGIGAVIRSETGVSVVYGHVMEAKRL